MWSYDLKPTGSTGSATSPPVVSGDEVWSGYEAFAATACGSTPCERKLAEVTVPGTVMSLAVANGHLVVGSWTGSAAVATAFAPAR